MLKKLLLVIVIFLLANATTKAGGLDVYFIDVEGGAATLIVTPAGESLLVDSGFPLQRDADRIIHVVRDVAKLKQIDHYLTTHWHRDHVGGIPMVAKVIPVKNFYDHGLPTAPAFDITPGYIALYRQAAKNNSVALKAGDELQLQDASVHVQINAANGLVIGEPAGAQQIKNCGADFKPIPEDRTDNANSLSFLMTYGPFKFYNGGDLTWNVENKLVCPDNLVGAVDVFQVNHHGVDNSNNPALVRALNPRVAIIGNGSRKGGDERTFTTLKEVPDVAIYQLHRNVTTTANAPAEYVANDEEFCRGEFIKLSVAPGGKSYTVSVPAKRISRRYQVR
ncbi:MAG TPA: MBL fold metallo-hydrolase [Pyrinomonadaceae bacterium]|nr:MBL fold metallo-hydrolase [Pyrinomonadaceae bacterium]